MDVPITTQAGYTFTFEQLYPPVSGGPPVIRPPVSGGPPVRVRNLTNTPEDCHFAGRLTVDAFRHIFVHATSERR